MKYFTKTMWLAGSDKACYIVRNTCGSFVSRPYATRKEAWEKACELNDAVYDMKEVPKFSLSGRWTNG